MIRKKCIILSVHCQPRHHTPTSPRHGFHTRLCLLSQVDWALGPCLFFEKEYPPEVGTCLVGATKCLAWLVQDKTSELSEKTMRSTSFRTTMLRLGSTWLHQARFHWQIHGLDCVPQSYWQFYADVLHILRSNWPAWWFHLYSWNNWILWQVQLFPRLPSSHPSFFGRKTSSCQRAVILSPFGNHTAFHFGCLFGSIRWCLGCES